MLGGHQDGGAILVTAAAQGSSQAFPVVSLFVATFVVAAKQVHIPAARLTVRNAELIADPQSAPFIMAKGAVNLVLLAILDHLDLHPARMVVVGQVVNEALLSFMHEADLAKELLERLIETWIQRTHIKLTCIRVDERMTH
jgi:hypothetical protein